MSNQQSALQVPVMVIHVSKGYESRAAYMEKTLGDLGIDFEYVLEGDRGDMDDAVIDKWFSGRMRKIDGESSCALKHLLACERIVKRNLPGALILEDDIVPQKNFVDGINACIRELNADIEAGMKPGLLSFEDSNLKYVPRSKRVKGRMVYEATRDRFAGCFYVPYQCAADMLKYASVNKCDLPIDLWHASLIERIGQPYYWSSPTFATQGSHCGLFASSLSDGSTARRLYQRASWQLKKLYKKMLYEFR